MLQPVQTGALIEGIEDSEANERSGLLQKGWPK
jgi:hypothetical protein